MSLATAKPYAVAVYKLDEASGNATDSSGLGHDAAETGGTIGFDLSGVERLRLHPNYFVVGGTVEALFFNIGATNGHYVSIFNTDYTNGNLIFSSVTTYDMTLPENLTNTTNILSLLRYKSYVIITSHLN